MKAIERWNSEWVGPVTVVRWGEVGTPVLVFPTAGGDAGEIERQGLVDACAGLLAAGRVKLYSVDSIAGRSWLAGDDPRHSMWIQNRFHEMVYREVIPAIRADCRTGDVEVIGAGASIGAFNAVASLCRFPDAFRAAVGMSGTYDLGRWLRGHWSDDFYFSSPLHFVPGLSDPGLLDLLRRRFVVLATGSGDWEDPDESWRMAAVLGRKGIPNRVDVWSHAHAHDWPTWREMLPLYLDDLA